MEESDSGQQPKRCPCGFWGSSQTSGLCSKCYKAYLQEKTQDVHDAKAELMRDRQSAYTNRDSLGATSSSYLATSCSQSSASDVEKAGELIRQAVRNSNSVELSNKTVTAKTETTSNTDTSNTNPTEDSQKSVSPSTSLSVNSDSSKESSSDKSVDSGTSVENASKDSQTEVEAPTTSATAANPDSLPTTPDRKGIKRDISALEDCSPQSTPEKPGAKSKKRCNVCKCKLELAQRTIGRCRCDFVFCSLHRLPEQHHCEFDHKEDGRTEARKKMVKPTRHLGTSFKRLGSDS